MMETTVEILTQYPFQLLLMAAVLRGALRAGLDELAGGDAPCSRGASRRPRSTSKRLFDPGIESQHRTLSEPAVRGVQLREQQGRGEELLAASTSFAARYPQNPLWRVSVAGYRASLRQGEETRRELECLAADFTDVPRDLFWLHSMSWLCEVVSFVGDVRRAAILHGLLLPYVDRCAVLAPWVGRGAVSRSLGGLATLLSRYDEAERHFEKALEINARIRARIWIAHTQHDYARMLIAREAPGDREKAAALAGPALATAREVGMKPLEANVLQLQAAAGLAEGESVEPALDAGPP